MRFPYKFLMQYSKMHIAIVACYVEQKKKQVLNKHFSKLEKKVIFGWAVALRSNQRNLKALRNNLI